MTDEQKAAFDAGRQYLDTSSEKQRERAKKSHAARKQRKTFKETLETLMSLPIDPQDVAGTEELCEMAAEKGIQLDYQTLILMAQAQKAAGGNTAAAQYLRDTIGEKPTDKMDVNYTPVEIVGEDKIED